ncbi:unnamed protein product, partial [Nesidiocoris tenuis]
AADEWLLRLNSTCPGALTRIRKLRVQNEYVLYSSSGSDGTTPAQSPDVAPNQG